MNSLVSAIKWFFTESDFFVYPAKTDSDAIFNFIMILGLMIISGVMIEITSIVIKDLIVSLLPRKPVFEHGEIRIYRRIRFLPEFLRFDFKPYIDQNGRLYSEEGLQIFRIQTSDSWVKTTKYLERVFRYRDNGKSYDIP